MNNKKGTKWALSCVATSAAVLSFLVVSNNVLADDTDATQNTDGNNQVVQTQAASGQTAASSTATSTDPSAQPDYSAVYAKINSQNSGQDASNTTGATQQTSEAPVSFKSVQGQPLSQSTSSAPAANTASVQATSTRADNSEVKYGGTFANDIHSYSTSPSTGLNLHPKDNELGYAAYFHIFANEAHLSTHTNGNVATGLLDGKVNFGTNIQEELVDYDVSYIQEIENIAGSSFVSAQNSRKNKIVFGNGIEIDVSNPDRPLLTYDDDKQVNIDHLKSSEVYQDKSGQEPYIDFSDIFNNSLEPKSQDLATLEPSTIISSGNKALITNDQFGDKNNRIIDLTDMEPNEDNQIVIYLSPDVLQESTPLTIRGLSGVPDGPTVIINVDTQGVDPYTSGSQIKVIYDDGSDRNNHETEYFGDNHLLWNFYDSNASDKLFDGALDFNQTFQGSVLAPKANVTVYHNLDGNIVADKVNIQGESHRWDLQDNTTKEEDEENPERETIAPLPIEVPGIGIDPDSPEYPDGDGDEDDNDWEGVPDPDPEEPGEDGDWTDPDEGNNGGGSGNEDGEDPNENTEEPGDEDGEDSDENTEEPGNEDGEEPGNETGTDKPVTIPGEVPGIPDYPEVDTDGDGIPDTPEVDTDGDGIPDTPEIDTDGDGIPDTPITLPGVEAPAKEVSTGSTSTNNSSANAAGEGTFPQTSSSNGGILSMLGLVLMSFLGLFGYKRKQN
ncbi:collagen-binding domain-containing protein [Companilactobacillus sp. HBUAS59699]|uniref:collagen-binding domain-containing protein n=1 Tax=Companilactobacillus sp. HBUAS59699 TaxID=3109358 RepID=UPI002FEE9257